LDHAAAGGTCFSWLSSREFFTALIMMKAEIPTINVPATITGTQARLLSSSVTSRSTAGDWSRRQTQMPQRDESELEHIGQVRPELVQQKQQSKLQPNHPECERQDAVSNDPTSKDFHSFSLID
jgi:hypothetical protein